MIVHITKEYTGLGVTIAPTYCGFKATKVHQLSNNSLFGADCPKCIDLYYQDNPSAEPCFNPYFSVSDPEGNAKLKAIKAKRKKKETKEKQNGNHNL